MEIQRTFNDAFAEARRKRLKTFNFNGGTYTTQVGTNPRNQQVGRTRTELIGVIPIVDNDD